MRRLAVVEPWEDIGSDKDSWLCLQWTNVFKLEISSLTIFYDVLLRGQFWVKNESKVSGRIREGDAVRAKSNWIREGNGGRFEAGKTRREREEVLFCRRLVWADFRSFMFSCRLCMHWVIWWSWSLHRDWGADFWSCVICKKLMVYRMVSFNIGERCSVQDEENGPHKRSRAGTWSWAAKVGLRAVPQQRGSATDIVLVTLPSCSVH